MHNNRQSFITKSLVSMVAGGLAAISLVGCGTSIELEYVGGIPDMGVIGLTVRGDLVYATTETDDLLIIDISTPEAPEMVGSFSDEFLSPMSMTDVEVSGDRAYFVIYRSAMSITDVSQPSQPVELGRYEASNEIYDIVIREPYAYLVGPGLRLLIVDISVPDAPVLVGELATPGASYALALSGDYAFIADYDAGLFVADVSDPTAPRSVGINPDPSRAIDIEIRGDRAYLTLEDSGLAAVDISNPEATRLLDMEPLEFVDRLVLHDDLAYVAELATVVAVDLSDPDDPRVAGEYEFSNNALWITSIAVSDEYIVVGRQREGFFDFMAGDLAVLRRKK